MKGDYATGFEQAQAIKKPFHILTDNRQCALMRFRPRNKSGKASM
jgi:hypothetical protein